MNKLFIRSLTASLGTGLLGQTIRTLHPYLGNTVLLPLVLLFFIGATVFIPLATKIDKTDFYILLFWTTAGLIIGLAK